MAAYWKSATRPDTAGVLAIFVANILPSSPFLVFVKLKPYQDISYPRFDSMLVWPERHKSTTVSGGPQLIKRPKFGLQQPSAGSSSPIVPTITGSHYSFTDICHRTPLQLPTNIRQSFHNHREGPYYGLGEIPVYLVS